MKKENRRRARWAEQALRSPDYKNDDLANPKIAEEALIDLLANLRHFCEREDLNFTRIDLIAQGHYNEER